MARNANIKSDDHALRILEAAYGVDDSIDDEAVDPATIARLRTAVDQAFARAWARVHERSRAEVAAAEPRPGLVRRFLGWTRAQLLGHLDALRGGLGSQLQLAHRKLETMTDDDLRSLVADLEDAVARETSP